MIVRHKLHALPKISSHITIIIQLGEDQHLRERERELLNSQI